MDANHIAFALGKLGLLPAALEDGLRRAEQYFRDHAYSPEAATAWAQAQRQEAAHLFGQPAQDAPRTQTVWDTLGMTQEAFERMPASWRMTQGRALDPPPVHSRRPVLAVAHASGTGQPRCRGADAGCVSREGPCAATDTAAPDAALGAPGARYHRCHG